MGEDWERGRDTYDNEFLEMSVRWRRERHRREESSE